MTKTYDAIVIGTGQAGPFLTARLTAAGMKVAVIERKLFRGTCVNTGCTPTKAMVASAHAAHVARRAADFGVVTNGPIGVNMKRVKSRKNVIAENPVHGRLGIAEIPYLTNSSILDLDSLPRHLIIVGGGYIGLEFAQMCRRFGSEVTIIGRAPRLARREDEDMSTAIRDILEREGINVRLNSSRIGFSRRGDEILAHLDCAGGDREVSGSHLLLAVGRRPNTDDLGLTQAGVAVDKHGYIVVDDQLRTSIAGIWALGDCNGKGAYTHTALNDSEIVGANLVDAQTLEILGAAILGTGGDEAIHSILDVNSPKRPIR